MNILDLRANVLWEKYGLHFGSSKDGLNIAAQNTTIPFIPILLLLPVSLILFLIARVLLNMRRSLKEPFVLLEITPPAFTEKTSYTTAQFFSVIHRLGKDKTFGERVLGRKTRFSFEIVSTRTEGIRYVVRTTPLEVNSVQRDLLSYLPGVQVKAVNEYLPENTEKLDTFHTKVIEFTQDRPFAYPLQKQNTLEEHDPVAYITGAMTKLLPGELISFQIVLSPTQTREAHIIKQKIFRGEDVLNYVDRLKGNGLGKVLGIFVKVITNVLGLVGWVVNTVVNDAVDPYASKRSMQTKYQMQALASSGLKPARMITSFEQQAIQAIEKKIDQPLFETRVRLLLIMKDKQDVTERVKEFSSSLGVFSVTEFQSLKRKNNLLLNRFGQLLFVNFQKRLLSYVFNSSPDLLSASEISDIYHFPFTNVTQTENIAKIHSKELPAPISLKKDPKGFDVVFAQNTYGGQTTMIGLTKEQRIRHQYIIGATGSGKSTMLLSMIAQDIKNGKGICVVDPHGDLAETIINLIPEERMKDFIYINPNDLKYPIGLNLLELTPGLDEEDSLREKQFIMESVISMFRKIFSDDLGGGGQAHRIEYILRNTIRTAFTIPNATLFTIYDLLDDPEFRNKAVARLQDDRLKKFWKYEFGKAGDYQRVKMVSGVTARIGRFLFSPSAERMLEQEKSTINFDDMLNSGKIVVCNLSRGKIGEDTSTVLGIMILNKIQLAVLRRAEIDESKRRPFYLYVDEFQHFATQSFVKMLSEARKYALNVIIAEQSTSQQDDRNLVYKILSNVGTVVCFKSANPKDEEIMLPQFQPYVKETEIMNLPVFRFYMKMSAIKPEEPFSGETILIKVKKDMKKFEKLIQSSRDIFATVYKKVTANKIAQNTQEEEKSKKKAPPKNFIPEDKDES